jgi:2-haloacid dehalogenase
MPQPPDTVIFDFGGVLVDWDPRHLYRKLIAEEAAMERFLGEICNSPWNVEQDRGRSLADATRLLVERHPEQRALIEAYYGRWIEMVGGLIPDSVAILEELDRRGVPLYGLTNWSAETFEIARPMLSFLSRLRGVLVSGRVKLIKPDRAIYDLLAADFGLEPRRCLFIDDSAANVEGAIAAGFQAVRFSDPATLRRDLVRLGLLP